MKTPLLRWLCVAVSLFIAASCGNNQTKQSAKASGQPAANGKYQGTIKVGHLVALDMAPLFLAKEAGFFKEEGLDVETVFFSNGGDNNTALVGGSIQFSTNPFTLPYLAANSGHKMRIISSAGGLSIMQVIIQGKYNISSVSQLVAYIRKNPDKKLKIAVLKGDTLEMIIYNLLKNNSLSYDDVEMDWNNDLLAMVQKFQTGQVDILSHIKPYTTNMIVKHGAKPITDNSEIWGLGTPNCTVAVMEDFMNKYPETCKAYLRALHKGLTLAVNEPERAAGLLTKENYYKVDQAVLLYALQNQPKEIMLRPNEKGMMMAIADLERANYIKPSKERIVNTTFLDEIEPKEGIEVKEVANK